MLKPLVPELFRPDLSALSKDIAEKHVPAKLKPTVGAKYTLFLVFFM